MEWNAEMQLVIGLFLSLLLLLLLSFSFFRKRDRY